MPSERARAIALRLSWAIWLSLAVLLVVGNLSRFMAALLFLGGFVPYVLCIQVIEPWLDRRAGRGEDPD